MFRPLEDLLVDAVFAGSGRRVLAVGYGTGSNARRRAAARRDGPLHRIDIDPMITAARARAESTPAGFLRANAQPTPAPARFDMIMSRFGVMFFKRS